MVTAQAIQEAADQLRARAAQIHELTAPNL
jgi:hypothetical protein